MSLSQSLFDLTGKTALITGGSSGLGAYFAEVLCDAGAKVAIVARRTDKLEEVAAGSAAVSLAEQRERAEARNDVRDFAGALKAHAAQGRAGVL